MQRWTEERRTHPRSPASGTSTLDSATRRILIVGALLDEHVLPAVLGESVELEVVAQVPLLLDAVRILTEQLAVGHPIDCVVVDLDVGLRTEATVRSVLDVAPQVTLIVVTDDERRAAEAITVGAHRSVRRRDVNGGDVTAALRFERLLAASTEVVCLMDANGVIQYASASIHTVLGFRPEDLVESRGLRHIHPDDTTAVVSSFTDVLADDALRPTIEFRYRRDDDSWRWAEMTVSNRLTDPTINAVVLNIRDITGDKAAEQALEFQARLLDAVGQAVVGTDPRRNIIYWNEAATTTYGWTAEEAIGHHIADRIAPADGWENTAIEVHDRLDAGLSWSGDFWVLHKDGHRFPVLVSDTPVFDDAGELVATIAISADISDRILHEQNLSELTVALTEDRRRLRDAQRSAHLGSFELNLVTHEVTWSDELYRILGLPIDTVPNRDAYRSRIHPDDLPHVDSALAQAVSGSTAVENVHRILRSDGQTRWIHARNSIIRDGEDITFLNGTVLDITERKLAEDTLAHQALHDPLTDLPNRLLLTQHLSELLALQGRGGSPVAVVFLDLDQFKVINDSLGHAVGDRVLSDAAARLRCTIGATSQVLLGRFGGDEFIAIKTVRDAEEATTFAEQLRSCLDAPFHISERELYLAASVGIAISCADDVPETVLANADAAMYRAKELGRARTELFDDSLRQRSENRLELTSELRRAFEHEELHIAYQPLIRLSDGATVGFEALLRWDHPELGSIAPDQFIPVAEDSGLIVGIGEWVLDRSLRQLKEWRDRFPGASELWMAVNLSARQLARPDIVERIDHAISRSGVPPERVHLEITESVLMNNIEASIDTVMRLRDLGMKLSVDDFGTGYSSLSYLKELPIHTLKIDRSFVDGLDGGCADRGSEHTEDTSIVEAILSLGRALHLQVLAEGIETQTQLEALTAMGCHFGQGFLWSRALPPDDAVRWIDGANRVG